MFTWCKLLFPSFNFFLAGESERFHDAINNSRQLPGGFVDICLLAFIADYSRGCLVTILFRLRGYGQFRYLRRRLVSLQSGPGSVRYHVLNPLLN
jgi:hypothetical protein